MKNYAEWSCKNREKIIYNLSVSNDSRRWYQRDIDQITHSICFRKLQRKSQLLSEKDPRTRSRLIHTIEVSRIAMEISEQLGLSKELTEAISLGHDIGTSPYGCIGNRFLSKKVGSDFSHEEVGALMLEWISQKESTNEDKNSNIQNELNNNNTYIDEIAENESFKLKISSSKEKNKTKYYIHHISPEIIDGVLNHGKNGKPQTLEGQVVKFADNIAYLSQDIEDLLATNIIDKDIIIGNSSKNHVFKSENFGPNKKDKIGWEDINAYSNIKLNDAYNISRGKRISTFINRFVDYNLSVLDANKIKFSRKRSEILNKKIPQLQCDEGLLFVIADIWKIIESRYGVNLIKTSNSIQEVKMSQLWEILNDERFKEENLYYRNFMNNISHSTFFDGKSDKWKTAYFISNLCWQEVDLIIDSFHERNYNFDLDLDKCRCDS